MFQIGEPTWTRTKMKSHAELVGNCGRYRGETCVIAKCVANGLGKKRART